MRGEQVSKPSIAWRVGVAVTSIAAVVLTIALVVVVSRYDSYTFPSESMVQTIVPGDRLLAVRIDGQDVQRGDIVVFRSDSMGTPLERVARVVAIGGDSLDVSDGTVRIDGLALDEPYLADGTVTDRLSPITVPESTAFLMGDNRRMSRDSRTDGPVPIADIKARVDYIGRFPVKWIVVGLWFLSVASLIVLLMWPWMQRRRRARDLLAADGIKYLAD